MMAVRFARRKSCRHSGFQHVLALVGHEHELALEHVDALVLFRVPVAKRGHGAGLERRQVDAELREPERSGQRALDARLEAVGERRRVDRAAPAGNAWDRR